MPHSPADSNLIAAALERELAHASELEKLSTKDERVADAIAARRRAAKDAIADLVRLAQESGSEAAIASGDAVRTNADSNAASVGSLAGVPSPGSPIVGTPGAGGVPAPAPVDSRALPSAPVAPSVPVRDGVGALTVGSLRNLGPTDGRARR